MRRVTGSSGSVGQWVVWITISGLGHTSRCCINTRIKTELMRRVSFFRWQFYHCNATLRSNAADLAQCTILRCLSRWVEQTTLLHLQLQLSSVLPPPSSSSPELDMDSIHPLDWIGLDCVFGWTDCDSRFSISSTVGVPSFKLKFMNFYLSRFYHRWKSALE